jgi:hypothetical protein
MANPYAPDTYHSPGHYDRPLSPELLDFESVGFEKTSSTMTSKTSTEATVLKYSAKIESEESEESEASGSS